MLNRLTNLFGPVFVRELVELSRKRRSYFLRAAYCLALLFVIYFAWRDAESYLPGKDGISRMAHVGGSAFQSIIMLQLVIAHLVVPMLVVDAIAGERQRGTLDLLLIADLQTKEILFGKLASRLVPALTVLFSTAPILILLSFFGGVSLGILVVMVTWILCVTLLAAMMALFYSVQLDWHAALLRTYHSLAFFVLVEIFGGLFLHRLGILLPIAMAMVASLCAYFFVRSVYHLQHPPSQLPVTRATIPISNTPASLPGNRSAVDVTRESVFVALSFVGALLFVTTIIIPMLILGADPHAMSFFWAIALLILGLAAVSNPLITRRPGFFDDLMMTPLSNEELLRGLISVNRPWARWIGTGLGILLFPFLFKFPVATVLIAGIGLLFGAILLLAGTLCSLAGDRPATRLWPMAGLLATLWLVPYWVPAPPHRVELIAQVLVGVGLFFLMLKSRPASATSLSVAFHVMRLYLLLTWSIVVIPAAVIRSQSLAIPTSHSELHPQNIWALMSPWFYLAQEDYSKGVGGDFASYRAPLYLLSLGIVCALTWKWSVANFDYLVGRVHLRGDETNTLH